MHTSNRDLEIVHMMFEKIDAEFMKDHGLVEEVIFASENNTTNSIDGYPHLITDEIIGLMIRVFEVLLFTKTFHSFPH